MNGWLLDTNVLSELRAGRHSNPVRTWVYSRPRDQVYVSILSLAEIEKGLHSLSPENPVRLRIRDQRRTLENFFRSHVLPLSDSIVLRWGQICGDARRLHGVRLDAVDSLLAATAVEHGLVLATRNIRDMQHTGAALFDPFSL